MIKMCGELALIDTRSSFLRFMWCYKWLQAKVVLEASLSFLFFGALSLSLSIPDP